MNAPGNLPREVKRSLKSRRGCVSYLLGFLSLVVLAVPVGLIRSWQAWRRGTDWKIDWRTQPGPASGLTDRLRIDLEGDIPIRSSGGFTRRLTDTVVRIAEHLRQQDDHYHHIHRIPGEPEALILPVGPKIQELGDRLILALGQGDLKDRTSVWLTFPARRAITEVLDPETYDPEADGEPEGLIESSEPRWATAITWGRIGPSTVYRVAFWIPETSLPTVGALLRRLDSNPAGNRASENLVGS